MAPYKILKQGYVMKEPPASKRGLRRKLHRYWFVLVEDPQQVALVYFKNEDAYISRQRNEGFIRVDNSISINVISEHLGSKNAFVIKSVRTDYTLVPESRYDLHEWLFTLHNAIEAFKTKQRKAEERRRMPLRLRANTAEAIAVLPPPSSDSGSLRTITPTRRAPPVPPSAATGQNSSSPRRKPVRPAPVAPRGRSNSQTHPMSPMSSVSSTPGMSGAKEETPPPAYPDPITASPIHSQEMRGNGGSPRMFEHPVLDLEISHTDRDAFHRELSCPEGSEIAGGPRSLHQHSASDTLLLMHQNSASLPDLINCEGVVRASVGVVTQEGLAGEGIGGAMRQRSVSESRHTRHLSLTGHEDIHAKRPPRDKKKRSARRNGSIKLRSRSPPNLPPPPPPAVEMGELQEQSEEVTTTDRQTSSELVERKLTDLSLHPSPASAQHSGDLASQSGSSIGFSEVMNTISNIDHELDEIDVVSPVKPSVPAPQRSNGVTEQLVANELAGREASDNFNEEEWLCDVPDEATPISPNRPTPEGGPQSAEEDSETEPHVGKTQNASKKFVPADKLVSSGFIPAATIESIRPPTDAQLTSETQAKPAKGKHRVMFKEEVEDIPSYEPRVDREPNANEEEEDEIPVGVAALKKKLFGVTEQETTKYKKEGVLSPKHTHPSNIRFGEDYKFKHESSPFYRESSPNVNNNNGSDGEQATPKLTDQHQSKPSETNAVGAAVGSDIPPPQSSKRRQEGLYETPWENSAVSKYKVIGRIRNGSSGKPAKEKERTPPPVSPKTKKGIQFGEVSTTETPIPGSTEIRNVHSLERSKLKKERIQKGHSYSLDRAKQKETSRSPPVTTHTLSLNHIGPSQQSTPPHTETSPHALTSPGSLAVDDGDLLASITDTLQKQSKYGSITLLSPPTSSLSGAEPSKSKKNQSEVRRSARGELEKIRAAHRREPPPPPMGVVTTPTHRYPQGTTTAAHTSPHRTTAAMHASPQRNFTVPGATRNFTAPAPTSTSPQGIFTTPVPARISPGATRTSPQGPTMVSPTMRTPPANLLGGATVAQPTLSFTQQPWQSPTHSTPKSTATHHSSQILISPTHRSWDGQSKRRMFSGRPRMAASLDELQADPSTQVTYDANSKSHIFRSLV